MYLFLKLLPLQINSLINIPVLEEAGVILYDFFFYHFTENELSLFYLDFLLNFMHIQLKNISKKQNKFLLARY